MNSLSFCSICIYGVTSQCAFELPHGQRSLCSIQRADRALGGSRPATVSRSQIGLDWASPRGEGGAIVHIHSWVTPNTWRNTAAGLRSEFRSIGMLLFWC